jgi:conjugal transfer pilus assembly protein TraF
MAAAALAGEPAAARAEAEPQRAYFDRHAEGWFWYHDPKLATPAAPPKTEQTRPAPEDKDDPVKVVEAERTAMEKALDRAIVTPTPENVKTYLELNQHLMAQAGNFAEAWRGAIWSNPSLDYSLVSPVGSSAYVKADQDAATDEQKLLQAAQQWGLVFFFRGTCPYCHKFAPLLRQFAEHYGFRIVDVSLDGGGLPEFPNPQPNNQAAENLRVEAVPAVYLVNPRTRQVVPAVFGLVGWSDLVQRLIYALDHANDQHEIDHPNLASIGGSQ